MKRKAELIEGKLVMIILISVFLIIVIGLSVVFKDRMAGILKSIFKGL